MTHLVAILPLWLTTTQIAISLPIKLAGTTVQPGDVDSLRAGFSTQDPQQLSAGTHPPHVLRDRVLSDEWIALHKIHAKLAFESLTGSLLSDDGRVLFVKRWLELSPEASDVFHLWHNTPPVSER